MTPRPIRIGAADEIGGQAAADADRPAMLARALPPSAAIRRSTAGCRASTCGGQLRIAAVHGQRILGQVVGADGEEIGLGGEQVGGHRRGRGLDHHAQRRLAPRRPVSPRTSSSTARTGRSSARLATIGSMIRHCAARAATRRMARSWARSRSGRHRLTRTPRRPSAGFSSAGNRQIGDRLVAADVERADDQRPAAQGVGDGLVASPPARPRRAAVCAVQEQEFGAQQAAALGAAGARRPGRRPASRDWRRPRCGRRRPVRHGSRAAAWAGALPRAARGQAAPGRPPAISAVAARRCSAAGVARRGSAARRPRSPARPARRRPRPGCSWPRPGSPRARSARRPPMQRPASRAGSSAISCDGSRSSASRMARRAGPAPAPPRRRAPAAPGAPDRPGRRPAGPMPRVGEASQHVDIARRWRSRQATPALLPAAIASRAPRRSVPDRRGRPGARRRSARWRSRGPPARVASSASAHRVEGASSADALVRHARGSPRPPRPRRDQPHRRADGEARRGGDAREPQAATPAAGGRDVGATAAAPRPARPRRGRWRSAPPARRPPPPRRRRRRRARSRRRAARPAPSARPGCWRWRGGRRGEGDLGGDSAWPRPRSARPAGRAGRGPGRDHGCASR